MCFIRDAIVLETYVYVRDNTVHRLQEIVLDHDPCVYLLMFVFVFILCKTI